MDHFPGHADPGVFRERVQRACEQGFGSKTTVQIINCAFALCTRSYQLHSGETAYGNGMGISMIPPVSASQTRSSRMLVFKTIIFLLARNKET